MAAAGEEEKKAQADFLASGTNTLRGGKNRYSRALEGNWEEDRFAHPEVARPQADTEEAARQAALTGRKLRTFGAPVLEEVEKRRTRQRYDYRNVIQPDRDAGDDKWRSTVHGSYRRPTDGEPVDPEAKSMAAPFRWKAPSVDEGYRSRWLNDPLPAAQQRFVTEQGLAQQRAVAPRFRLRTLRSVRGVPKAVEVMRDRLVARHGVHALTLLRRTFEMMDDNGDGELSKDELRVGLQDAALSFSVDEFVELFSFLDRDGSGKVSWPEFLHRMAAGADVEEARDAAGAGGDDGMRPSPALPRNRLELLREAFDALQRRVGERASLTKRELRRLVDMRHWPDVAEGRRPAGEALELWLAGDPAVVRKGDLDPLEWRDFRGLYEPVGAAVSEDDDFAAMVAMQCHLESVEGVVERRPHLMVLVTHEDGHKSVESVEMGEYFDRNNEAEIRELLARQGIHARAISLEF